MIEVSKIDTLIAFGCSHTQGDESVADFNLNFNKKDNIFFSYPFYLSKLLDCKHYYNYAVCGSSNQMIASTFFEKIKEHHNEISLGRVFVVIGWTCSNRIRVAQYTEKSYTSIRGIMSTLSAIKRLKFKSLFCKTPEASGEEVTISKGIIRLIARIIHGVDTNVITRKYRNINEEWYETKIKPHFKTDFILGIDKHIFNTGANDDTNTLIKLCVDLFLTTKNIPYIALPTMRINKNSNDCHFNKINNILPLCYVPEELSFIQYYGEKYGISSGGGHMKFKAHEHFAKFLYEEIVKRDLIAA